jgi:hypothetical protein
MRIICGRDNQHKDMLPLTGRRHFLFILLTQGDIRQMADFAVGLEYIALAGRRRILFNFLTQRNIPTQGITLSGFYRWARLFYPFRAKTCIELNDKNAMKNPSSGCKPIII